ncbi:uncharacterized protein LOC143150384 [Ptiloglossa arizonensis]|uniref:uncharacterized protein LOC143150384 n=1 Tax=Ptiloglossa arizonensis TaxID=3350558 RepID=UPI003FA1800A
MRVDIRTCVTLSATSSRRQKPVDCVDRELIVSVGKEVTRAYSKSRGSRMRTGSRANHLVASKRPSVSVVAALRVHDVIVFFEKCVGLSRTHASGFSRELRSPSALLVPAIAVGVKIMGGHSSRITEHSDSTSDDCKHRRWHSFIRWGENYQSIGESFR